jgi:hypothetical protein
MTRVTADRRKVLLGATTLAAASALGSPIGVARSPASAQTTPNAIDTRIGKLEFTREYPGGYPTKGNRSKTV